jgi:Ca2+-binding EF-hand superfamily protein
VSVYTVAAAVVAMPIILSPEELAAYKKQFIAIDLNKDGLITPREFATVSKVCGYKLEKEEIMVSL